MCELDGADTLLLFQQKLLYVFVVIAYFELLIQKAMDSIWTNVYSYSSWNFF